MTTDQRVLAQIDYSFDHEGRTGGPIRRDIDLAHGRSRGCWTDEEIAQRVLAIFHQLPIEAITVNSVTVLDEEERVPHSHITGRRCAGCAAGDARDRCHNCGSTACEGCEGPTDDEAERMGDFSSGRWG